MPTLVLRQTIPTAVKAPATSPRSTIQPRDSDRSLEGVLIFSAIGFGLIVLAAVFSLLELPSPVF